MPEKRKERKPQINITHENDTKIILENEYNTILRK